MNTSQKTMIALLILAIVFSAFSIAISLGISNLDFILSPSDVTGNAVGNSGGGLALVVESVPDSTGVGE
ncbi:MAG: hypothetical protein Q8P57_04080 [Candidatus Pacearchaeota archaeon]|nr:hypothetical protein [Candidatus Pacearchaeota archaeon]